MNFKNEISQSQKATYTIPFTENSRKGKTRGTESSYFSGCQKPGVRENGNVAYVTMVWLHDYIHLPNSPNCTV